MNDTSSKALVMSGNASNIDLFRASTDAANLCKAIVVETAMEIQGRKYVQVEGWQAIAVAHGCAASARSVERVQGGVRAIGEIRRMSDGAVIAEAEGFVGEDEPTWFGGTVTTKWGKKDLPKRPDYAIRAMAQTRAVSRACRSAFAHVVVMMKAGLQTTPAEEVPEGGFNNEPIDAEFTQVKTERPRQKQAEAAAPEETDEAFIDRHEAAIIALTTPEACDTYYKVNNADIKARLEPELGGPLFAKLRQRRDALAAADTENPFEDAQ